MRCCARAYETFIPLRRRSRLWAINGAKMACQGCICISHFSNLHDLFCCLFIDLVPMSCELPVPGSLFPARILQGDYVPLSQHFFHQHCVLNSIYDYDSCKILPLERHIRGVLRRSCGLCHGARQLRIAQFGTSRSSVSISLCHVLDVLHRAF